MWKLKVLSTPRQHLFLVPLGSQSASRECLWQSICRVQGWHRNDLKQCLHTGLWKAEGPGDGPAGLSVGIEDQIEQ